MGAVTAVAGREHSMDALTAVRGAVDQLQAGALGPLFDLLAEDVEFEVAGGEPPELRKHSGRQAAADYFAALGGLTAFWRMEYSMTGDRVIAWGNESFRLEGSGLEGESEFALVLDLSQGRVDRLRVIEDLAFIPGWDMPGAPVDGRRSAVPLAPGTLRQSQLSCGRVGVMGRLLRRPVDHVPAGATT